MNAALHANLARPPVPGFSGPPPDLGEAQIVRPAAQIFAQPAFGKGAELATVIADIGVVDVAVDRVGDDGAVHLGPQRVGGGANLRNLGAAALHQADDLRRAESFAAARPRQDFRNLSGAANCVPAQARQIGRRNVGAGRPVLGARKSIHVHRPEDRPAQARIQPPLAIGCVRWIDGEALGQHLARGFGFAFQGAKMRPGRFRIDIVRAHRRDAAPIVDAGTNDLRQGAGRKIGRRLNVHLGPKYQPCRGDGPEQLVQAGLRRRRHSGARFGAEILDDDFLDVPVTVIEIAQRQKRIDPFPAGLADTDQQAGRERHAEPAGRLDGR